MRAVAPLLICLAGSAGLAQEPPLPPLVPWDGQTRELIVPADDPWITPSERTGLTETPSYEETVAWLERLVAASPKLRMVTIGESGEGRDIVMVIASNEGAGDARALAANRRPTVLVHGGIHSGEIDGKDAGLMILRGLTVAGNSAHGIASLLDRVNLLFIPILNVDGHERSSRFGRINQRGPVEMGWRTNARNLNLNRDFTKLDTPEVQALIRTIVEYDPHLYIDVHVTDGIDYEYDITYGFNGTHSHSPHGNGWLANVLRPAVDAALARSGHVPGPLVFPADDDDLSAGIFEWNAPPRFSNGYGDARHLPSILVENHSLDPYDQRVLGTYVFLREALRIAGEEGSALRRAIARDRALDPESFPLDWGYSETPGTIDFRGVRGVRRLSGLTGGLYTEWTGEPVIVSIPLHREMVIAEQAARPAAWWIPAEWSDVIENLRAHGILMEPASEAVELDLEMYRLVDPRLAESAFEGRVRLTTGISPLIRKERMPAGSVRVPADQPLADLAALLLEPLSEDSLLQWGFFHSILSRTEYIEAYVVEPLARRMIEESPELYEEYLAALAGDPELAGSVAARRRWFYERSPWIDDQHLLYPVGRELP
ncbi:MAG: M14 family metallopeptidase [Acidobacteria bacterium]|nr:M14 family metallopeptidase [Acidobacteriota bacterium]